MLAAILLASLWAAAADAGSRSDAQDLFAPTVTVPVERFMDALAVDLVVNAAGLSADLLSTDRKINQGCREGNPLAPRVEGRIALKIGLSALRGSVSYLLRRTGHRTLANVWRWAGGVTDASITTWNLLQDCGGTR